MISLYSFKDYELPKSRITLDVSQVFCPSHGLSLHLN